MRASLHIARRWRRSERRERRGGFTLLEVMIAMAILSVALVALAGINSGAMNMHAYSKRLTVATFLARSKMADLEQKLQSEGLPADDEADDGTFEEEGSFIVLMVLSMNRNQLTSLEAKIYQ
jgi:prepilin-type N-terminal cleavage/methylation domain-containing protein